jgi:exopolyphosphatase/guanosine-5'-triphosphate,3'-diphosphate pyrophosphatase
MSGAGEMSAPVGAIDCGTNSTRLLIAGPGGATVERKMVTTRLGAGVDQHRRLAPDAIARTVAVLADYRQILDRHGVTRVRMTATSAARDASNREDFFAPATETIGVRPELLSGEQEGQLSFAGAVAFLDGVELADPYLVADIGGGSSELAVGPAPHQGPPRAVGVRSLDVGCVRLTERYLHSDPPLAQEMEEARHEVRRQLEVAMAEVPSLAEGRSLIGLAGTVAALAAIEQGLDDYQRDRVHHYRLRRSSVERMLAELAALPAAERSLHPGVEAGRVDIIVGGTIVVAELMAVGGFHECLTSESDILDGLAASLQG